MVFEDGQIGSKRISHNIFEKKGVLFLQDNAPAPKSPVGPAKNQSNRF